MPNRIIKDSIHTSETCDAMTDFQFRLWINLITYVDDYGRGDARPAIIKGTCFPLRERLSLKDIEAGLIALAGIGCIALYTVDGKSYLCFPTWESHQTIRNKKSRFPAPPDNLRAIEIKCTQAQGNVPVIQSNPNTNPNTNNPPIVSPQGDRKRFAPPTLQEVEAYCRSRHNHVDPQRFIDYYSSNGWRVGKNPMKDWQAAVRTWEKNNEGRQDRGPAGTIPAGNPGRDWGDIKGIPLD